MSAIRKHTEEDGINSSADETTVVGLDAAALAQKEVLLDLLTKGAEVEPEGDPIKHYEMIMSLKEFHAKFSELYPRPHAENEDDSTGQASIEEAYIAEAPVEFVAVENDIIVDAPRLASNGGDDDDNPDITIIDEVQRFSVSWEAFDTEGNLIASSDKHLGADTVSVTNDEEGPQ